MNEAAKASRPLIDPGPLPLRGLLLSAWHATLRFPRHLTERDFWIVQMLVGLVTAIHLVFEASMFQEEWAGLHHLPVIFYLFPISYASIKYRWEGGLITSAWSAILVIPSILMWHRTEYMWLGETARLAVVVGVGVTLASRVEREMRMRIRAEASEERFRGLFEAAGDAILVYDDLGTVVAANAASAPFFGVDSPGLLEGQPIGRHVPSWNNTDASTNLRVNNLNNHGSSGPRRVSFARSDGQQVTAEAVVSVLPGAAPPRLYQAVFRDASAQELREKGLRSLVQRVTQAQEDERERIARELHDDSVQALMLLQRELKSAAEIPEIPEAGRARLATMAALAAGTGDALRRFSRDLRPSILNDLGLVPAIEWLTEDLARRTTIVAHFNAEGRKRRLPRPAELALFRIAQEALRNTERHAHATTVEAHLCFEPSGISLTIADNGAGFASPDALEDLVPKGKLGIIGMKERASLLGGTVELRSAPGAGTTVQVRIPL